MRQLSCLLAVAGFCAAVALPTQTDKTLVVARDENNESASTTPLESTTPEPLGPIKISEMDVKSEIALRYSHTAVVTKVRNTASKAQEAHFHVLLPNTAFISGFVMTLNGKSYKAYVKEKEAAKQIYNEAVSQGLGAAHVAVKARDSNQFTVSVNVEPNTDAVFNLTYEELLERRNGVYNHAINLHPSALVPKLTVTVHIKEGEQLTTLRVPEIRTGNEIDATENDAQNTKAKIEKSDDGKEATITFTPDLDEQQKLMDIYREKSKEARTHKLSWYGEQEEEQATSEGNLGQFVVQYDVERSNDGEILVNDGYFVHFFAPNSLPQLNKHVVFVLDTSGSMMGRKIEQLREAMLSILSELHPGDYFNIVEFSSDVAVHDLKDAEKNETKKPSYSFYYSEERKAPLKLVPPSKATKENIDKAKIIIGRMDANGGTNIDFALRVGIDLVNKGIGWTVDENKNNNKPDEEAEELPQALPLVDNKPKEETTQLEPIIIFLTDGEPTVGISDTNKIISRVSEKNYGEHKTAIFSLAFGEDADRNFLRKLSLLNEAFMRHIYEASDAALQLRDFYKQVSSPLLSNVRFVYPPNQVNEKSLTKHKFHTYYRGSEVVVAGKVEKGTELQPEVLGFCGVDDSYTRKKFKVVPKFSQRKPGEYLPLERLWAYITIKQLLDAKDADKKVDDDKKNEETPEKRALELALKYEFVTPLTSLVVVKPNATSAVDAESVDKPESAASGGFKMVPYTLSSTKKLATNTFGALPLAAPHSLAIRPMAISNYMSYAYAAARPTVLDSPGAQGASGFAGLPSADWQPERFDVQFQPEEEEEGYTTPATTLDKYRLNGFTWVNDLLQEDTDSLQFINNGTSISLKLSTDQANNPTSNTECEPVVSGAEAGVCMYLVNCEEAKYITSQDYPMYYCDINGFAGVCCPKKVAP